MAKWLCKWRRGWLYVRSNTKNAKSLITKGKRELIIDRIVGDFLYLNHDEYNDLEIWRDSLWKHADFHWHYCLVVALNIHHLLKRGNIGISSRSNGTHPIKLISIIMRQPCSHPGRYPTFILVEVCGPKGRKWGFKGCRMGRSDKVSLWYVSSLDFAFLFKNKQLLSAFNVTLRQRTSKWLGAAIKL